MLGSPCSSEMATSHIVAEFKAFQVKKETFTTTSPYFAAAFTGWYSEALDLALKLGDEDPEVFHLVVDSVYQGNQFSCGLIKGGKIVSGCSTYIARQSDTS